MTAREASHQWATGANDALDSAEKLFASKKYHHALFFCHLAIEKALKARFIAEYNELPPYTHDVLLLSSKTTLNLSAEQLKELAQINTFNIAARYEEEKINLLRRATENYTAEWLKRTQLMLESILP